jgi:hypothetical protein
MTISTNFINLKNSHFSNYLSKMELINVVVQIGAGTCKCGLVEP